MKLDAVGSIWIVNIKNQLLRCSVTNSVWESSLIAEGNCYIKSRVQGKLLRVDDNRNYLFWKNSDSEITRINVRTGTMRTFTSVFQRTGDFITDFKSNNRGSKLCVLSRYGNILIFLIDKEGGYDVMTRNFPGKCGLEPDINTC